MLFYSRILDTYYDNKKDYNNEYHNFRYHCDPFYKQRHKKYMMNYYNKNKIKNIKPIITISHNPKIIIWS